MEHWKPEIDKPDDMGRTRASNRLALILIAEIDDGAGHKARMRVRNISESGFGGVVDIPHKLKCDLLVTVRFGSTPPIDATVMRVQGADVGLRFDEVVDPEKIKKARANPLPTFQLLDMHKVETPKWMLDRAKRGL